MMLRLDHDPNVISWQSEELIIPYTNPIDGRFHRYLPDFKVIKKTSDGIKTFVIEIKPHSQCLVPTKGSKGQKSHKKYLTEAKTFAQNQAKWQSAQRYCAKYGYTFLVLTEKDLKLW